VRPPVSRIGNKWGYASAISRTLGLTWRELPERIILNDADADIASLWACLLHPPAARAAAAIIRGWAGEEPRPLWDRLRAQLKAGELERPGVEWLAAHTMAYAWSGAGKPLSAGFYRGPDSCPNKTTAGITITGASDRVDALATWAASWVFVAGNSWKGDGDHWKTLPTGPENASTACNLTPSAGADRIAGPSRILPRALVMNQRAEDIPIPDDATGWLVYIDPPYQGTTGYAEDWARPSVLAVARRWATAGAQVLLSETEPLPLAGFGAVEITALRQGAARTFGATPEWLTTNAPIRWRAPVQRSLFAQAAPAVTP